MTRDAEMDVRWVGYFSVSMNCLLQLLSLASSSARRKEPDLPTFHIRPVDGILIFHFRSSVQQHYVFITLPPAVDTYFFFFLFFFLSFFCTSPTVSLLFAGCFCSLYLFVSRDATQRALRTVLANSLDQSTTFAFLTQNTNSKEIQRT